MDFCIVESDTIHLTAIIVNHVDYVAPSHDSDMRRPKSVLKHICQLLCKAA